LSLARIKRKKFRPGGADQGEQTRGSIIAGSGGKLLIILIGIIVVVVVWF
jgi:hypothetical protein